MSFLDASQSSEGENITCQQCGWGGGCEYKYLADSTPAGPCNASSPQPGTDRAGSDKNTIVLQSDDYSVCEKACCDDDMCFGWVYVPHAPSPFLSCKTNDHCCYLKNSIVSPTSSSLPGITSGQMNRPQPHHAAPSLGIRSAVPMGGLGAGALELRGDGTFHEVCSDYLILPAEI